MNVAPNLLVEAILDTPLISRSCTFEPEGHRDIAKGPKRCDESRLLLILDGHLYLMITGVSIQETQTLTTRRGIDYLINSWEGKRVFGTSLVEICVVNTHAPSAIFL